MSPKPKSGVRVDGAIHVIPSPPMVPSLRLLEQRRSSQHQVRRSASFASNLAVPLQPHFLKLADAADWSDVEDLRDEGRVVGDGSRGENARLEVDIVVQLAHDEKLLDSGLRVSGACAGWRGVRGDDV